MFKFHFDLFIIPFFQLWSIMRLSSYKWNQCAISLYELVNPLQSFPKSNRNCFFPLFIRTIDDSIDFPKSFHFFITWAKSTFYIITILYTCGFITNIFANLPFIPFYIKCKMFAKLDKLTFTETLRSINKVLKKEFQKLFLRNFLGEESFPRNE